KLVYLGLMKLSDSRPVVLMYVSSAMVTCAIGCVVLAVRRARGQTYMLDRVDRCGSLVESVQQLPLGVPDLPHHVGGPCLILLALAVSVRRTTDSRQVVLIGAITTLLPLCGGLGMGVAPGLFVGLLGIGVIYFRPGGDPHDRTFAAWSFAVGLIASYAWS